ncbi:MAG: hypothetical protein FWC41_02870 [Firmicutes bacterium]|nr:hypothetical protein [Bacillota bacterium]
MREDLMTIGNIGATITELKKINKLICKFVDDMKLENRVPPVAHAKKYEFESNLGKIIRSDFQTLHNYMFGSVIGEHNLIEGFALCTIYDILSKYTYQQLPDILRPSSNYFLTCEYDRPRLPNILTELLNINYKIFKDLDIILLSAIQTSTRSRLRQNYSDILQFYSRIATNDDIEFQKYKTFINDYDLHLSIYLKHSYSNTGFLQNETTKLLLTGR